MVRDLKLIRRCHLNREVHRCASFRHSILKAASLGQVAIIGVGGIASSADALLIQDAGADLVQFYTGLIYRGPGLVNEVRVAMRHGQ